MRTAFSSTASRLATGLLVIAVLTGLSGCGADEPETSLGAAPPSTPSAPAEVDEEGAAEATPPDVHLTAGQTAHIADEGIAVDVTVASPRIIKAPEFWSGTSVVIATVTINVTAGQFSYDESAFTLVLDDGTRIDASTVASDEGLPAKALGSGNLTAPDKAKGLITFSDEHLPKTLTGTKIQLRDDAAGRDWALG